MDTLSSEDALLLTLYKVNPSPGDSKNLQDILAAPLDWKYIFLAARRNGIAPLVYRAIKIHNWAVPESIMDSLARAAHMTGFYNMNHMAQLCSLLEAFNEARLQVAVFKGAFFLEKVYGDPSLRAMGDLDLLIRKEDFLEADFILSEAGFKAIEDEYPKAAFGVLRNLSYQKPDQGLRVDLHWHLVEINSPFKIDIDAIWSRCQQTDLAGRPSWVLSAEDLLLYICVHGFYNHYLSVGLKVFSDLAALLDFYGPDIDWGALARRAAASRVPFVVYAAFDLLRRLDKTKGAPREFFRELASHCTRWQLRWLRQFSLESLIARDEKRLESLVHMRMLPGIRAKALLLGRIFFPPPDLLALQYSFAPQRREAYLSHLPAHFKKCLVKLAGRL